MVHFKYSSLMINLKNSVIPYLAQHHATARKGKYFLNLQNRGCFIVTIM